MLEFINNILSLAKPVLSILAYHLSILIIGEEITKIEDIVGDGYPKHIESNEEERDESAADTSDSDNKNIDSLEKDSKNTKELTIESKNESKIDETDLSPTNSTNSEGSPTKTEYSNENNRSCTCNKSNTPDTEKPSIKVSELWTNEESFSLDTLFEQNKEKEVESPEKNKEEVKFLSLHWL